MKDEILQTALPRFLQHGIREMSIQKLIEPLGISTKTVYKYFRNKEELLEAVLELHYAQQYQLLEKLSVDQPVVSLLLDVWHQAFEIAYQVKNVFFKDLHYYYPALEEKIQTAIGIKFTKQFIQIIQKGIDEGSFQKGIVPKVAIESIYVLYDAAVRTGWFNAASVSPHELLLNTIVVYIRGFCTTKGIGELDAHVRTFQGFTNGARAKKKGVKHV